jgi:hypothetical protein
MIPYGDTQQKYETEHLDRERELKEMHHHIHDEGDDHPPEKRKNAWWQFWRRGS